MTPLNGKMEDGRSVAVQSRNLLQPSQLSGGTTLKKRYIVALALIVCMALTLVPAVASANTYTIGLVFKLYGDDWFNRLEEGVKRFAADTGHNAFATGPPLVDPALQVQIIEDLIRAAESTRLRSCQYPSKPWSLC